jgi:adenylate cyclase
VPPTRQLAAMLLTDIVGYSSLTQRDERRALQLLRAQERCVRPVFRSFRGRVVKSLGDGFLVEFPSALSAVNCAIRVQKAISRAFPPSAKERIELRIGVHLGDIVRRGKDVFGDAVNIVARIEPIAEPGGVCVTQQVYDQVRNKVGARFESIGTPELKSIRLQIPMFRIDLPSARPATPSAPSQGQPRVGVLPLVNISGRPEDEYFADGITEELIQTMSGIAGLRTIGRSSTMRFKGTTRPPSEIARELGASAIVEGSIRTAGNRLRVTVRLLDGRSEESLWSESYDREIGDVFRIQTEIAERVASALRVEMVGPAQNVLRRPITLDSAAHSAYLQGRYLLNQRSRESLFSSIESFRAALRLDPHLAEAQAGLADAYSLLAWLEFLRPREAFPQAKKAALRAIELDPSLAEAHTSLGFVQFLYDRSWLEAEREFRRAISLNPNYPVAHQFYSDLLKAVGRLDEAQLEVRRALELDPLSLAINTALGHVLYLSRQYDAAIEQYRKALRLDPNFAQARLWFGRPYLEKRMFKEAIAEVRVAVRLSHESTMSLAVLGHAYASAGQRRQADRILGVLRGRARSAYVPSYWIAMVYVGLGDADHAFQWLDRADKERSAWLAWIKVEPRFDGLRSDPRFSKLLRRLKLA